MNENTVNPNLRLSEEEGHEDFLREEQVRGHTAYDWRDWLNHIELTTLSVASGEALAKARFYAIKASPDIPAALINFKITVMLVKVSHAFP